VIQERFGSRGRVVSNMSYSVGPRLSCSQKSPVLTVLVLFVRSLQTWYVASSPHLAICHPQSLLHSLLYNLSIFFRAWVRNTVMKVEH
jgi:hypothetical protein